MNKTKNPWLPPGVSKGTSNQFKYTFPEVKQRSKSNWLQILTSLGIPAEYLTKKSGQCPVCGGKDRFRYDDKENDGTYFCNQCGPGDGFSLLMRFHNWTASKALEEVAICLSGSVHEPPKMVTPRKTKMMPDEAVKSSLDWSWENSIPIGRGSPPDLYLRSRAVGMNEYPSCLRWRANAKYCDENGVELGRFNVMIAQVVDSSGEMVAIHRTYLLEDGRKAPVEKPKKLTKRLFDGATRGAAIRLFKPEESMIIAEGIETALASCKTWNLPAWSAIAAGGMETIILPDAVKHVVIAADHDENGRGEQAARKLSIRLRSEGRTTQILMPEMAGLDMADIIKKQGD